MARSGSRHSGPSKLTLLTFGETSRHSSVSSASGSSTGDRSSASDGSASQRRARAASARMTGKRSCSQRMDGGAAVVRTAQESMTLPLWGSCQRSQTAAKAKGRPPGRWIQRGDFDEPSIGHSKKPSAGTRARRCRRASRKEGLSAAVSTRALMSGAPTDLAQEGISPQRMDRAWGAPLGPVAVTTGIGWVGATLYRGGSGQPTSRPRMAATCSAGVERVNRPHIGPASGDGVILPRRAGSGEVGCSGVGAGTVDDEDAGSPGDITVDGGGQGPSQTGRPSSIMMPAWS